MGEKTVIRNIPQHIGFIMDGNRRWAKKNGQPDLFGHKKGSEALELTIRNLGETGVKYATFFAFSSENWSRSAVEVEGLMKLFLEKLAEKAEIMQKLGAKVKVIGRKTDFSEEIQDKIVDLEELTAENEKIVINFAFSYGGRTEIIDAVKEIIDEKVAAEDLTETVFCRYLYEAGQPDPDLIIRTGGVQRLSGFLLWQAAYAELYFCDTLWPDFNGVELNRALEWYAAVKRNFGK